MFIEYGIIAESMEQQLHVVTGAFGYTGKWIAENGHTLGKRYQNDLKERKYRSPKQKNN